MLKGAIPLLHVNAVSEVEAFYCKRLGFTVRSTYRLDPEKADPAYVVVSRDRALLHLSSFSGDGVAGGVVTVPVSDIGELLGELVAAGIDVGEGIMEQSWGDREVYIRDLSGNAVRFQEAK